MKQLISTLLSDKSPYLLTIFFASLGWVIVRSADHYESIPAIEYSTVKNEIRFSENYNRQVSAIRIHNITHRTTFRCLIFSVHADSINDKFVFKKSAKELQASYFKMNGNISVVQQNTDYSKWLSAYYWQIKISNFPPEGDVEYGMETSGSGEIHPRVTTCQYAGQPESGDAKADAVFPILMERSITTRFAEDELFYLWFGLLAWLVTISFLVIAGGVGKSKSDDPQKSVGDSR